MPDRSFIESWSLNVDDIAFVEGFNLVSRVWVAFQLRFFRTHGRFPSREDDPCPECLWYLGRQLDLAAADPGRFRFHHVGVEPTLVSPAAKFVRCRESTPAESSASRCRLVV